MTTSIQQHGSQDWNNPGWRTPGWGSPGLSLPWPFGPLLLAALPSSGPATGGNQVTLIGLGLNGATQVRFGVVPATIVGSDPLGFTLNVLAPAGTPGSTVPVTVTTSSGTSNSVQYTYVGGPTPPPPPTATSIVPNSGPTTGGTPFVINGTGLTGGTVTFNGLPATVLASTPTVIVGLTPPGAPGNVPVVVTTTGGTATVPGGYTYLAPPPPPPTITATVSPTTSVAAGGGTFTIVGTNLTGATVTFGGTPATITSNTDTVITGTIPAGTAGTTVPVVVTTGGGSAFAGTVTYLSPPVVTATVSPAVGLAAGGDTFTIGGTNLTGATVTFGANAATITSNTGTVITGTVPAGTAGTTVPVVVTTGSGSVSGGAYTYV